MKKRTVFILFLLMITLLLGATHTIDLASWNGNFSVKGNAPFDAFGYKISQGDINGDGFDDIIAGAYYADPLQRNAAGSVYIFWGTAYSSQEVNLDLSQQNADVVIYGAHTNDQLGKEIAVGNINNDQYDDIIISAPFANANTVSSAGNVYILFGSASMQPVYDFLNQDYDSVILGENANDFLGISLAVADINNDNFDDVIAGTPSADNESNINCGKSYVIFGSANINPTYNLANQERDIVIIGENMNDNSSWQIKAGNYNNDS